MTNKQKLIPLFTLLSSFVVLYFTFPRFVASLYSAYPRFVEEQIDSVGLQLANEAYPDLIHSINNANQWSASPSQLQLLSIVQTDQYSAKFNQLLDTEKQLSLKEIEDTLISGLTTAPINPFAWYQLALIRQDEALSKQQILEPVKMSILLQRVAPDLLINRIALLLKYKNNLDEPTINLLLDQIRIAWQFKPGELLPILAKYIEYKQLFYKAFKNNPEQLTAFEKSLEHTPKQNH